MTAFCEEIKKIEKRSCGLVTVNIIDIQKISIYLLKSIVCNRKLQKKTFKHKSQESKFAKLQT